MRIGGDLTSELVGAIARTSQEQELAFQQLSSGRRIQHAADDPAAFSLATHTASRLAQNDEFTLSSTTVQAIMENADSTLNSVIASVTRAVSLGVEGANGSVSGAQRQAIAAEVRGIRDTVLSLANASFNNTYLFAGTKSTAPPFVLDASSASGVTYVGSNEVNQVQVAESVEIQIGQVGNDVFSASNGDVFGSLNSLYNAFVNNDATAISAATAEVRRAFDHISTSRVFYGNSLHLLEQNVSFLSGNKVELSKEWDGLVGVDATEAVSRLMNAQQAHDRTLAAAAKVSALSLLDYLK